LANAVALPAAINVASSAVIASMSTRGQHRIPLWAAPLIGRPSTITDSVGTFFLLPLITCVTCTAAVHQFARRGRLPRLAASGVLADRLPQRAVHRGLVLGALCVAVLAPPAVVLLAALDPGGLSRPDFVLYKGFVGLALGLVVTPVVAIRAMADPTRPATARRSSPLTTSPTVASDRGVAHGR
jgi:hypothetical protein